MLTNQDINALMIKWLNHGKTYVILLLALFEFEGFDFL